MNALDQIKEVFEKFKSLHPNNAEQFSTDLETVKRWQWSILESERRSGKEVAPFNIPDNTRPLELARSRSFSTFGSMPTYMREKYAEAVSFLPGRVIFALGSRVSGEYIDKTSPISIKRMREALFKKETKESDYDILVELKEGETIADLRAKVPKWVDIVVRPLNRDEPKILLPMWDFSRLPKEKHPEVIALVEAKSWGKLMDIHNEFSLSTTVFCCDSRPAQRWFSWAIETGVINDTKEKTN